MSKTTDFILGCILIVLIIIALYQRDRHIIENWIDKKIDQISSMIKNSCELPYGLQDKIETTYEILNSSTCTNGN